eukprot:2803821-Pleurochrysis_carterae.AAC.1
MAPALASACQRALGALQSCARVSGELATAPNGNGGVYVSLQRLGILDRLQARRRAPSFSLFLLFSISPALASAPSLALS